MKRFFNLSILAIYELKLNKKLFGINIVICGMLFGVMLAMCGLAMNMPKEIQHQILDSEIGVIQISNIDYKDIEYITQLPLDITVIAYDMDWSMFEDSLNSTQRAVNDNWDIDNSLNFAYKSDSDDSEVMDINHKLILGNEWEKEDNEVKKINPLWMDESLARCMDLDVGDQIILSNSDCSIDFYVKGIYCNQDKTLAASYVSAKLYGTLLCEKKKDLSVYAKSNTSVYELLATIHSLKNDYFIVESYDENIYAMFLLVVFVYIVAALLLFITLGVMVDFNTIYFSLRQRFWAMNKALGLTDYGRKVVCCIMGISVIIVSYVCGSVLSKLLSGYFTEYIKTLFDFTNLNMDMTGFQRFVVLLCSVLLGCLVLWNKNVNINSDIKG